MERFRSYNHKTSTLVKNMEFLDEIKNADGIP
jgi:hypothetical protein